MSRTGEGCLLILSDRDTEGQGILSISPFIKPHVSSPGVCLLNSISGLGVGLGLGSGVETRFFTRTVT